MSFTEKIVVAKISAKVMNSFKVMQFIYKMKSSVVALFSVNLMYSVNFMSVKVMLHCIRGCHYNPVVKGCFNDDVWHKCRVQRMRLDLKMIGAAVPSKTR